MSEIRTPSGIFRYKIAQIKGKKNKFLIFEMYKAQMWEWRWRPYKQDVFPRPPLKATPRIQFYRTHYRLRINRKWYKKGYKFTYLTMEQVWKIIQDKIEEEERLNSQRQKNLQKSKV